MTKSKSTKRAFVVSLLALTLCFAMLVGTTWAWFTDTVTSGRNRIYGGYLDVELVTVDGTTETPVDENTVLFDDVEKWEPGVISYETLKVKNVGDVALKYTLNLTDVAKNTITKDGGTPHDLTEVIKVAVTDSVPADRAAAQRLTFGAWSTLATVAQNANLDAGASSDPITIVLYWEPTDHDDDYNRKNTGWTLSDGDHLYIDFGATLIATQYTKEQDSFDERYDADATMPETPQLPGVVAADTADALHDAFEAADDSQTNYITLEDDITGAVGMMSKEAAPKDIVIDLNGKTLDIDHNAVGSTGTESQALHFEKGTTAVIKNGTLDLTGTGIRMGIQNYGDLTLENVNIIFDNDYALSLNNGNVTIKNCTITVPNGKTAFDVCVTNYYPDGVKVYIEGTQVEGNVEFDVWGSKPATNKATLTIGDGNTFNGDFVNTTPGALTTAEIQAMVTKTGTSTYNGNATLIG